MTEEIAASGPYSRREVLGAIQMMDWAVSQMYYFGAPPPYSLAQNPDPQSPWPRRLLRLDRKMGHHRFRDHIADLAPAHAEGERLGQEAARIADYRRSHDVVWTECFVNLCCDFCSDGFRLKPNWQRKAMAVWANIAKEVRAGVAPDFETIEETRQRLGLPPLK